MRPPPPDGEEVAQGLAHLLAVNVHKACAARAGKGGRVVTAGLADAAASLPSARRPCRLARRKIRAPTPTPTVVKPVAHELVARVAVAAAAVVAPAAAAARCGAGLRQLILVVGKHQVPAAHTECVQCEAGRPQLR